MPGSVRPRVVSKGARRSTWHGRYSTTLSRTPLAEPDSQPGSARWRRSRQRWTEVSRAQCRMSSRPALNHDLGRADPAMAAITPAPFWSLTIPDSLQAQATTVRNLVKAALPSAYSEKQTAPPSPPATPTRIDQQLDLIRRARFSSRVAPARSCVRCGARTSAVEGAALDSEIMVGRWRRFEAEWNGRCICGGLWRRVSS